MTERNGRLPRLKPRNDGIEIATGGSPRNDDNRHPEERSDVGIYLCEDAEHNGRLPRLTPRNDDNRHPEERSDVGIYR